VPVPATAGGDDRATMKDMIPSETLLPGRSHTFVAGVVAVALVALAAWYVAAGGPAGRLVDHDAPPVVPLSFSVDVNAAAEAELAQLPGIGPALARRIADRRGEAGPFAAPEDLLAVPGIGPATLAQLRPHLRGFRPDPAATEASP